MARQAGFLNLVGPLGEYSYYKTDKGYFVRKKGGIKKERMMTDPALQRVRDNASEFGRASQAGRLLRTALQPVLQRIPDRHMTGRLTREMVKVIRTGVVNNPGLRRVEEGNLQLLQGFEFNEAAPFAKALRCPYHAHISRETGGAGVSVRQLVPWRDVRRHQGATHLKLLVAAVQLDFKKGEHLAFLDESEPIGMESEIPTALSLSVKLPAHTGLPQFLVLGIEYCREVGGALFPLNGGEFNALSLVQVSAPHKVI